MHHFKVHEDALAKKMYFYMHNRSVRRAFMLGFFVGVPDWAPSAWVWAPLGSPSLKRVSVPLTPGWGALPQGRSPGLVNNHIWLTTSGRVPAWHYSTTGRRGWGLARGSADCVRSGSITLIPTTAVMAHHRPVEKCNWGHAPNWIKTNKTVQKRDCLFLFYL